MTAPQPPQALDVRGNRLFLGGCAAEDLARQFGTPLYVYEEDVLRRQCRAMRQSFAGAPADLHYAVKANHNPSLLRVLKDEGLCIDAVSPFEVRLCLELGFPPGQILFTGNNTTEDELRYCLQRGVPVNVGSLDELEAYGRLNPGGAVAVRINPDLGAGHHPHVITGGPNSKFGIYATERPRILETLRAHRLRLTGIHVHIGSGILRTDDMLQAMEVTLREAQAYPGLEFIDFGGGFGIAYRPEEKPLALGELGSAMAERFNAFARAYGGALRMKLEPGRFLVAQSGTLLARVTALKSTPAHAFVGTDTGFNHLIRPLLYGAFHRVLNASQVSGPERSVVVAGNVCESGDVFTQGAQGLEEQALSAPQVGQLLAICDVGAYGMALSSQYNLRPRPPEVLVRQGQARLIRRRETYEDLLRPFAVEEGAPASDGK
ncbi:MAG TPA: diaminopimelate decarboxylase [bacterium]|nr:diaminopimelate decarboxylase [bacterium]